MSGYAWAPQHRELVLRHYGRLPVSVIAKAVGRSPSAVRNQAANAGVRTGNRFEWTTRDIDYLRRAYVARGAVFVAMQLRRSVDAVRAKAFEVGVTRERARMGLHVNGHRLWCPEDDAQICAVPFAELEAVAKAMGRTLRAAAVRRSRVMRRDLATEALQGP